MFLFRNADPVVRDGNRHLFPYPTEYNTHRSLRTGVLGGVVEQMRDRLLKSIRIEEHRRQGLIRLIDEDRDATLYHSHSERFHARFDDATDVGRLEAVELPPRFDLRKVEDIVDELGEAAALALDVFAILADLLRLFHPAESKSRRRSASMANTSRAR